MNTAAISTTGNEVAWRALVAGDLVRRRNTNTETRLDAAEISQRSGEVAVTVRAPHLWGGDVAAE
jgi:hypothetical protein